MGWHGLASPTTAVFGCQAAFSKATVTSSSLYEYSSRQKSIMRRSEDRVATTAASALLPEQLPMRRRERMKISFRRSCSSSKSKARTASWRINLRPPPARCRARERSNFEQSLPRISEGCPAEAMLPVMRLPVCVVVLMDDEAATILDDPRSSVRPG